MQSRMFYCFRRTHIWWQPFGLHWTIQWLGVRCSRTCAFRIWKEMMAISHAVIKWRLYLLGRQFQIPTEHKSLKFFLEQWVSTLAQQSGSQNYWVWLLNNLQIGKGNCGGRCIVTKIRCWGTYDYLTTKIFFLSWDEGKWFPRRDSKHSKQAVKGSRNSPWLHNMWGVVVLQWTHHATNKFLIEGDNLEGVP